MHQVYAVIGSNVSSLPVENHMYDVDVHIAKQQILFWCSIHLYGTALQCILFASDSLGKLQGIAVLKSCWAGMLLQILYDLHGCR